MSERPSSSNAAEIQPVARISVKDRLGPLPSSFKRRDRSVERNHRRGRKFSKSAQGPETNLVDSPKAEGRIPVRDRLGPLGPFPPQYFKKPDQFHKRNRHPSWRPQGKHDAPQQSVSKEPESNQGSPTEETVENVKYVKPPLPSLPSVQPFNAEQHRQAWTWVRPTTNLNAMDIDGSIDQST